MAKPIKYVAKLKQDDPNSLMREYWYTFDCVTVNDFIDWSTLSGEVVTYDISELVGE